MNKEEPKQETLEEAAKRILANNIDGLRDALKDDDLFFFYKGVIQCYGEAMAKYQAKRMYSEEDMLKCWNAAYIDALSIDEETYKPLFFADFIKQFKKNNND